MRKTFPRLIAVTAALAVLSGGVIVTTDLHKEPILIVDGQQTHISGFYRNVDDVLRAQGIEIGEHDTVAPDLNSDVHDGDLISVRYGRPLELVVDGRTTTHWTTETDVEDALRHLGFDPSRVNLSEKASRTLGRDGLKIDIATVKIVTVTVDGQTYSEETLATTVGEALELLGIAVDENDHVSPGTASALTSDTSIVVERVN